MSTSPFHPGNVGLENEAWNSTNSRRPRTTLSRNRVRTIGAEAWLAERDEVYRLYITENLKLVDVMRHYDHQYRFKATRKQWKDKLAKWQFRKRLNPQDAAFIAWHLTAGEADGRERRVCFNNVPKSMADIRAYVRKSDKIHSLQALMAYLDIKNVPSHITVEFADEEREVPRTEGAERSVHHEEPFEAVPVLPTRSRSTDADVPEGNRRSSESFQLIDCVPSNGSRSNSAPNSNADGDGNNWVEEHERSSSTRHSFESQSSLDIPNIYPDADFQNHATTGCDPSEMITSVVSISPLQTGLSPGELDLKIYQWMGDETVGVVGEDCASEQRVLDFLRHCCAAAIHSGQTGSGFPEHTVASLYKAVETFDEILAENPWDSLSTLNNMFVLLAMHGHHFMIMNILNHLRLNVNAMPASSITSVVKSALLFMTSIPHSSEDAPKYNLAELRSMVFLAEHTYDPGLHDQFKLSARFMYAWALLEMKEIDTSLRMLRELKDDCEEVFGIARFQTINCIATLARAQAMAGKVRLAANTYSDLVQGRIRQFFSPSHPQYWDAEYRLACYDRRLFDDLPDEEQRRAGWIAVAERMLATLRWREEFLGASNPITLQNFRAARKVLTKLNIARSDTPLQELLRLESGSWTSIDTANDS